MSTKCNPIGHGNRDHETSSNRGRFERFTTPLSKPDLDRLLNKALQAPSVGGSSDYRALFHYTYLVPKCVGAVALNFPVFKRYRSVVLPALSKPINKNFPFFLYRPKNRKINVGKKFETMFDNILLSTELNFLHFWLTRSA